LRAAHKRGGFAEAHECHTIHRRKAAPEGAQIYGVLTCVKHDQQAGLYCRAIALWAASKIDLPQLMPKSYGGRERRY
jgi:hypothetical protein